MKKTRPALIAALLFGMTFTSQAENLLEVYDNAVSNNPALSKSFSQRQVAYANINQSIGALLPQIGLSSNYTRSIGTHYAKGINYTTTNASLVLSQTLFNMVSWRSLNLSQKNAALSDIIYKGQEQNLILQTATAYFDVLKKVDILSAFSAQKEAIGLQLDQTKQRYEVGLLPVLDVENAKAQYDQTLAQEVSARNELANSLENLRQISGYFYTNLATLSVPVATEPVKYSVPELLERANKNNLTLIGSRMGVELAEMQIKIVDAARFPVVSLQGSSSLGRNSLNTTNNNGQVLPNKTSGTHNIGATPSIPIYTGGQVTAQAKQAKYSYEGSLSDLESTKRNVENSVRSNYNNIVAAASAIQAYEQTVVSSESSLKATSASYNVGTRTILDVLTTTTSLYNAKQKLSSAKYDYLTSLLALKASLGELDRSDLESLNEMLNKKIETAPGL